MLKSEEIDKKNYTFNAKKKIYLLNLLKFKFLIYLIQQNLVILVKKKVLNHKKMNLLMFMK